MKKNHQYSEHIKALELMLSKDNDRFSGEEVKLVENVIQGLKDLEAEIEASESGSEGIAESTSKRKILELGINLLRVASYGTRLFEFFQDMID